MRPATEENPEKELAWHLARAANCPQMHSIEKQFFANRGAPKGDFLTGSVNVRILLQALTAIGLVLFGNSVRGQSVDISSLYPPLIEGDRALRFEFNVGDTDPNDMNATVFYSTNRTAVSNLQGDDLFSGRPVLLKLGGGRIQATFVFTHRHRRTSPNRDMYFHMTALYGNAIVINLELEHQRGFTAAQFLGMGQLDSPLDIHVPPNPIARGECVFYRIRLEGRQTPTTPIRHFRMPGDFCVALLGDSYGAGQGAPDDPLSPSDTDTSDMWADGDCHRSNKSGLVRGVKSFSAQNPDLSVFWTHQACSGDVLGNMPTQLQAARDRFAAEGQEGIHLIVFSIGGNDIGFADHVINYIYNPLGRLEDIPGTPEDELQAFADRIAVEIVTLAAAYDTLATEFEGLQDLPPLLAITTYPDPTFGPYGRCGTLPPWTPAILAYPCCTYEVDFLVNPVTDYSRTSALFIAPLNNAIRVKAGDHGWRVVELAGTAGERGICYCRDDPWYNLPGLSLLTQGDPYGTMHPTAEGYKRMYRDRVATEMTNAHNTFVMNRTFGMLFGWVPLPLTCEPAWVGLPPSDVLPKLGLGWRLKQELNKVRFQLALDAKSVDPRLRKVVESKDLQELALQGDIESLRKKPAFKDLQRVPQFARLRSKGKIDPRIRAKLPRQPLPMALEAKKQVETLFASPEFQAHMKAQAVKLKGTEVAKPDPEDEILDKLFKE
jgi:hypothetical protein